MPTSSSQSSLRLDETSLTNWGRGFHINSKNKIQRNTILEDIGVYFFALFHSQESKRTFDQNQEIIRSHIQKLFTGVAKESFSSNSETGSTPQATTFSVEDATQILQAHITKLKTVHHSHQDPPSPDQTQQNNSTTDKKSLVELLQEKKAPLLATLEQLQGIELTLGYHNKNKHLKTKYTINDSLDKLKRIKLYFEELLTKSLTQKCIEQSREDPTKPLEVEKVVKKDILKLPEKEQQLLINELTERIDLLKKNRIFALEAAAKKVVPDTGGINPTDTINQFLLEFIKPANNQQILSKELTVRIYQQTLSTILRKNLAQKWIEQYREDPTKPPEIESFVTSFDLGLTKTEEKLLIDYLHLLKKNLDKRRTTEPVAPESTPDKPEKITQQIQSTLLSEWIEHYKNHQTEPLEPHSFVEMKTPNLLTEQKEYLIQQLSAFNKDIITRSKKYHSDNDKEPAPEAFYKMLERIQGKHLDQNSSTETQEPQKENIEFTQSALGSTEGKPENFLPTLQAIFCNLGNLTKIAIHRSSPLERKKGNFNPEKLEYINANLSVQLEYLIDLFHLPYNDSSWDAFCSLGNILAFLLPNDRLTLDQAESLQKAKVYFEGLLKNDLQNRAKLQKVRNIIYESDTEGKIKYETIVIGKREDGTDIKRTQPVKTQFGQELASQSLSSDQPFQPVKWKGSTRIKSSSKRLPKNNRPIFETAAELPEETLDPTAVATIKLIINYIDERIRTPSTTE